ncbi:hypothetical protein D0A37_14940 [Microcoleus vaginatus HSN003]|nr:hypothetical protein D0A37_14940 [Microcoleus vaginatus HSN003]
MGAQKPGLMDENISFQPADVAKNPVSSVGGNSETGFDGRKYFVSTRRCGQKPGFFSRWEPLQVIIISPNLS